MRTALPDAEIAAHLRLSITRAARRLRQEGGVELSPSLSSALAAIERHGPLTPSELAVTERVQRPTITRVLARLDDDGLIERSADPGDGRSTLVSISDDGRRLLGELRTRKDAFLAQRLKDLDESERALLNEAAGLLERLLEDGDGS